MPLIESSMELIMRCHVCQHSAWHRAQTRQCLVNNAGSRRSGPGPPGSVAGRHRSLVVKIQTSRDIPWARGHLWIEGDSFGAP